MRHEGTYPISQRNSDFDVVPVYSLECISSRRNPDGGARTRIRLDNRLLAMDRSRLRLGTWNVGRPPKASRTLGGRPLGASSRRLGLDCWPLAVTADYDPKTQHRLCDFNAGLTKKSHVWEEAHTKIQTKPFLRPSGAPCRAGSIESNKKLQPTLSCLTIQLL